jgi:hypothetical protein
MLASVSMRDATGPPGTPTQTTTRHDTASSSPATAKRGAPGTSPSRSCTYSARLSAATSPNGAAAPRKGRSTWPEPAPGRSASTYPKASSPTLAGCSPGGRPSAPGPSQRRGRSTGRRQLRHCVLRPRGDELRRPLPHGSRGRPAAATRRAVRLLPSLADRRPVLAGYGRPGGRPAGTRLLRDARIDAVDEVVFQLPYGKSIRLFRANGFEILDLIEPRPAPDAVSSYRDDEDRAWARRWPAECIWRLRRT